MLKYKRIFVRYSSDLLRRCLAVIAICAMSFSTTTSAKTTVTYRETADAVVHVANVEELYSAVNDTANGGAVIVAAPGIYVLSINGPDGSARPNRGRLELQPDMSLIGVAGDRSAVVIDTSLLPRVSFDVASVGRTGAIRTGRGSNSIEWLTIIGNPQAAGAIETDLAGSPTAEIRVAHVVSSGSSRGLDVRNVGPAMAGRRIEAEIVDNEFYGGAEGIRFVNFNGANGGQIYATMSGNLARDNQMGCIVANNRSSSGVVEVRSNGDRFENNGAGCVIAGAIVTTAAGATDSNSTTFEAHGSKFVNNTGAVFVDRGGIVALGAETAGTNIASNNAVVIRLWGCKLSGNQNADFEAFGARSTAGISGTNNTVRIELFGASKHVDVVATDSLPFEAAGTNRVTVVR